ncbi:YhgE/Pip domain-containing protein, partial [Pradoshia sp.]|uniref:YhgE/Pip domain-containing protein n=1 Tax=Pradoshia sp. TaxID=2651281 RepID=UPI003F05146D
MNEYGSGNRFSELRQRRGFWVSIIAVLLVPLLYGLIMLTPSWGPYDNLSNLPVAVVNNDAGTVTDGKEVNVGRDLVSKLKEGNDLGWRFVSSSQAQRGLKDNDYYMVIEIPEDFSRKVATVMDENPEKPELKYTQNEGLHFIAATATNSAIEKISNQLSNTITETYTETVFASLGDVGEGFSDGAAGAKKLNDGSKKLHDGTGTLLGSLTGKAGDINKLADGANQVADGNAQVNAGWGTAVQGSGQLANGAGQLAAG